MADGEEKATGWRFRLPEMLLLISAIAIGLGWWTTPDWIIASYITKYESVMIGVIALCLLLLLEELVRSRLFASVRRVFRPRYSLHTLAILVMLVCACLAEEATKRRASREQVMAFVMLRDVSTSRRYYIWLFGPTIRIEIEPVR